MARVLYITYDGLLEPLGQSQVWQYLRRLAPRHRIVLLSFEKPSDANDARRVAHMRLECERAGIRWVALRYHRKPTFAATSFDITAGIAVALWLAVRERIQVVHARSYVASVIAVAVKRTLGVRFIFDMRGFWADERVDGGLWPAGGVLYKLAKGFEKRFFANADAVVSLTRAALEIVRPRASRARLEVIPTCTDLSMFVPDPAPARETGFVLGYVGSVGSWYLFDEVVAAFAALLEHCPDARFLVVNKGGHDYVRAALGRARIPTGIVEIVAAEHRDVPALMHRMDAGVFFYRPAFSRAATAPTRLAEFLACGIPVWINRGIGDMDEVVENGEHPVGVIIDPFSSGEFSSAARDLLALAREAGTTGFCREVAERRFSVEAGCDKYSGLYEDLA